MTEPIRVLIADDEDLVRSGLSLMLGSQPGIAVVGDAADGAQAVAQAQRLRPDIVLMDIRMPGMDGLQATARITAAADDTGAGHQVRVIILTTFEQDEYVYEALRAGASGFLLKRTRPEDLIEAIRVVANGDALLAPSVTRRLIAHFAHRPTTATATAAQLSQLTERERDVLIEIAGGLSNTEIACRLFVGEQTVKTHIKHIFTKLDLRDRAQAVVFAYETGLVRAWQVDTRRSRTRRRMQIKRMVRADHEQPAPAARRNCRHNDCRPGPAPARCSPAAPARPRRAAEDGNTRTAQRRGR